MSYKTLLVEEISEELKEGKKLTIGANDYKAFIDGTTKLMDRQIELEKLDMQREQLSFENDVKAKQLEIDQEYKDAQLRIEKRDRLIKNTLTGIGTIGGLAVTVWGAMTTIKFEETGSFTSLMGRGFIQKLLPKK